MERNLISHHAHADHPIAAPVSEGHLERLLTRAKLPARARILDLGCGEAAWLVRALSLYPDATADGVDLSDTGFAGAAEEAGRRGVSDRLRLHHTPAAAFTGGEPYDLVLCVGATHAFGGLMPTLDAVRGHLRPSSGLALVGEGFWERPPSPEQLARFGAEPGEYADLAGTVARAENAGFATVYGHTSTPDEWDEYEWSWTGTLTRWALDHPGPDGEAALAAAREHRDLWLGGYRGFLGFVTLLLRQS
ncbi:SAM-dependent methyltransferase [Nonomuraea rubra]|uniref:SAM-dependent methyltransferase n=1 Tax=Nonomuraea rubra TaxID=46180 RepID=A0A7X0NUI3_9ACTN|nr:class I SAM-dependent methyltransferase [Nonomuraea rubra]MBB6549879.1 SAM-dependent methyltransferase [Nonomuraea rubra]